jgi:uroporphyrinogen III methyltransferase / synthase
VDLATFTSASSVRGYIEAVGEDLALKVPAASIGPQTSAALTEAGIEVKVEAEESTIDGLVAAVMRAF